MDSPKPLTFVALPHATPTIAMITLMIQGMQDGRVSFDITAPASDIPDILSEFADDIHVSGTLTRSGRRFTVRAEVTTVATLICDRSLEEFAEPMRVPLELVFVVDTAQAIERQGLDLDIDDGPIPIRDDAKVIDITDVIRQELVVHLPLRRVSPKHRDTDVEQLYGGAAPATQQDAPSSDTWAALRGLQQRDS